MPALRTIFAAAAACILPVLTGPLATPALAQDGPFPQGTLTITVPLAAGGPADTVARIVAQKLQTRIGRNVIVENKGGAGGNIGAAAVARAEPNGMNWIFALDSIFTVNPHIYTKQGFDPDKDLVPVATVYQVLLLLAVNAEKIPAKTWPELLALSKTRQISFASAGIGSPGHLAFEYLRDVSGLNGVHVPYRGAAPAMQDIVSGVVDAGFVVSSVLTEHVRKGTLRALAVSTNQRVANLPDVPSADEVGLKGFDARFTNIMMTQPAVSKDIRDAMEGHLRAILDMPDVREKMAELSAEPAFAAEAATRAHLLREREKWGRLLAKAGVGKQ